MVFKAEATRADRARKERGWLAWHIGALSKCDPKRFPKLDEITGDKPAARVQTPQEMKAVFAAMRARRE